MYTETFSFTDIRERHKAMELILHDRIIGTEFFNFVCGDLIGWGTSRYVFEYKNNKAWVVKIDCSNYSANNLEWQIWSEVSNVDKIKKWFAPCGRMTTCGRVMLQRRCKTNLAYDLFPKKIPDFFTDTKYQNWGMLNGKIVCFDYASTGLLKLRSDYKLVTSKFWHDGQR